MKQHRQRNGQEGIAMIIVVCIMAVLVMMSLALLLASSVMTQNAGRVKDQEQSRILAVSLADELEKELTVTPSQQEKTKKAAEASRHLCMWQAWLCWQQYLQWE